MSIFELKKLDSKELERRLNKLPDVCTVKDLIELGLYASTQGGHDARNRTRHPKFHRKEGTRKYLYDKIDVIEYIYSQFKIFPNKVMPCVFLVQNILQKMQKEQRKPSALSE